MNEPIAVEARFEPDGSIRPLVFHWRGERYRVEALGRQWEGDGERHFLVMTPDGRVYELVYLLKDGYWRLRRRPQDNRRVRPAM